VALASADLVLMTSDLRRLATAIGVAAAPSMSTSRSARAGPSPWSPLPQFVRFYGGGNITSITVSTPNAPDFAFGDFNPVPEPISLILLATGLTGLSIIRHRGWSGRGG
jgi:hypothetical protein